MRVLLLLVVVAAAPVFAQSLPGQQASRLVLLAQESAPSLALPPLPPPVNPLNAPTEDPFAPVYRRMFTLQIRLLELQRVSIAGPLAVTLVGGTALLTGGVLLFFGYAGFVIGLVMMACSALPLLIGIPWLVANMSTNSMLNKEIAKLKLEVRQLGALTQPNGALLAVF